MVNNKLNETTIGSAKVIVDILPKGKVIPNVEADIYWLAYIKQETLEHLQKTIITI